MSPEECEAVSNMADKCRGDLEKSQVFLFHILYFWVLREISII